MARNSGQPRRSNRPNSVKLLQKLENGLDAFMDASVDAFLLFDDNLDLMSINPAGERLFGVSKEMVVGANIVNLEPGIEETRKYDKYLGVIKTGDPVFLEEHFSHPKFGDMHSSIKAFKMRNGLGMIVNDITKQRRMEEALRESELLATATIEEMADGVMLVGMDGKVAYINKAFEKMLGYKLEELVGTSAVELPTYHGSKDRKKARQALKMVIEKGSAEPIDMVALSKDGMEIPINFTASVVKDAKGNPKTLVAVIRDVTERKKAEGTLRESEKRLRDIAENSREWIWEADTKGKYTYSSPIVESILGYTSEEILEKHFYDLFHPDDRENLKQEALEAFARKESFHGFVNRNVSKDGKTVWLSTSGIPLLDNAGNLMGYRGSDVDITERKRIEEEVRLLSDAVRMTTDSVAVTDMSGRMVDINEAGLRMYGLGDRGDFVGKNPLDAIVPEVRRKAIENMAKIMETGQVNNIEYHVLRKDGSRILIETSVSVIKGGNGEPRGLVAVARDITERKRVEEALRQSEKKYRQLIENMQEGLWLVDKDFITTFVNPRMAEILGYTAEEMLGKLLFEFTDERGIEVAKYNIERKQSTKEQHDFEFIRKDGARVYASLETSSITDEAGNYVGALACVADITERKKEEEKIQRSYEMQTALNLLLQRSLTDTPLEEQLQLFLEHIFSIDSFGLKAKGAIFLVEGDPGVLVLKAQKGLAQPLLAMCARVPFGRCLCGRAALSGEAQFADCLDECHENRCEGITQHGHYCVPILSAGEVMGVVNLYVAEGHTRDEMEEGFLGAVSDVIAGIVQRKRMEEELRRLSDALKMTTESIAIADLNGIIVDINEAGLKMYGLDNKADLVGKTPFDIIALEDHSKVGENMSKMVETGLIEPVEYHIVRKDGKKVLIETSVSLIKGEKGEPKGFVAVARDITESRKAEEMLRESEERFRVIFDNSVDGILVTDLETNSLYTCNKAMCQMLGYNLEEIGNLKVTDIHPKKDLPYVMAEIERERLGESPGIKILPLERKDGSVLYAEVTPSLVTFAGRQYLAGIFRDISERKRAEEEKQRMEEQLLLAGRLAAVGELAAGVANELNNPIAAIQGFAQLLTRRNDLDETMKSDLGIIYRESQRAAKITQNLLSFARRHEPEKHLISLNEVIEKTLELRAHPMKVNNIEVVVDFAADLPKTMADFFQMQQVFVNIINNAEQAMIEAHGKGRLVVKTQKAGDMIRATFADNGPGIPEDNIKRIFDPFFTTKEVGKGTGLGLSICYGLIEAHSGRIYARSKLGEGATFVVEIPIISEGQ